MLFSREEYLFYFIVKKCIGNQCIFITSHELADHFDLSNRTIKEIMKSLKEKNNNGSLYGADIVSERSKGYTLQIVNKAIFEHKLAQMDIQYHYFYANPTNPKIIKLNIMRRLIFENHSFSLEQIENDFFTSSSNFRNHFLDAEKTFSQFGITFNNKNGNYKVSGHELTKRACAIELFGIYYHDYENTNLIDHIKLSQLSFDTVKRKEIRSMLLSLLRKHNISMIDSNSQKISLYLILAFNRTDFFPLTFDDESITELKDNAMFHVAKEILTEAEKYLVQSLHSNEVYGLTILLLYWIDAIPQDSIIDQVIPDKKKLEKYTALTQEFFIKNYSIDISEHQYVFKTFFLNIYFKTKYSKYLKNDTIGYYFDNIKFGSSFLFNNLSKRILDYVNQRNNIIYCNFDVIRLTILLDLFISNYEIGYIKRRVLITNEYGKNIAEINKRTILKEFGTTPFEYLDVYESYEIRALDLSKYDIILLASPKFTYNYKLPYLVITPEIENKDLINIKQSVIKEGYTVNKYISKLNLEKEFAFDNTPFESWNSLITSIAFKYGDTQKNRENISSNLAHISSFPSIHNNIVFIDIDPTNTNRNFLDIYKLTGKIAINKSMVKYVIVHSIKYSDVRQISLINSLIKNLAKDTNFIERVIQDKNTKSIDEYIRESL